MASTPESSSRPGHLDTTWEVAVISSCIIIFVVAISVVIYQVRRRKRLRRMKEEEENRKQQQGRRSHGEEAEKTVARSRTVPDLERGVLEHTNSDPSRERDEDYTDLEDEGQPDYTKSKRNSTSPKSKTARSKKHPPPLRKSDSPTLETEVVSHPSQMPPKYYWNHR